MLDECWAQRRHTAWEKLHLEMLTRQQEHTLEPELHVFPVQPLHLLFLQIEYSQGPRYPCVRLGNSQDSIDSDGSFPPHTELFPLSCYKDEGLSPTNEEFKYCVDPDLVQFWYIAHPLPTVRKSTSLPKSSFSLQRNSNSTTCLQSIVRLKYMAELGESLVHKKTHNTSSGLPSIT